VQKNQISPGPASAIQHVADLGAVEEGAKKVAIDGRSRFVQVKGKMNLRAESKDEAGSGAGDGIRTRDVLLGRQALYR
jgi:hypothetical protein